VVYGVTLQRLGRRGGHGIAVVFVDAPDSKTARARARRSGEQRYGCVVVLADQPVPGAAPPRVTDEHHNAINVLEPRIRRG
jgi:hypothetical protein